MTASALRISLLRELDPRFRDRGFLRWSDDFYGDQYHRVQGAARQTVSLVKYPEAGYLGLDIPFISVHFQVVEELVAKFDDPHPLMTETSIWVRPTLGFQPQPNLFSMSFKEPWPLATQADVIAAASVFVPRTFETAELFWKKCANLTDLLTLLLIPEDTSEYTSGTQAIRVKRAVATALLLEGVPAASEVATVCLSALKGATLREALHWLERALPTG